ncbi:MAG: hypothetical protein RRY40_04915 [Oscillospiraceae bacterium]
MNTKIFEILMLVSFGAAWPASIYRSYKAKTAKGKSLAFLLIIEFGYICGIINKLINSPDYVMYLYALNFLMVMCDVVLYFKNRALDKLAKEAEEKV